MISLYIYFVIFFSSYFYHWDFGASMTGVVMRSWQQRTVRVSITWFTLHTDPLLCQQESFCLRTKLFCTTTMSMLYLPPPAGDLHNSNQVLLLHLKYIILCMKSWMYILQQVSICLLIYCRCEKNNNVLSYGWKALQPSWAWGGGEVAEKRQAQS